MTVLLIGNEPQPDDVTFPPGRTTLVFKAQASPASGVMVKYRIESSGVTFENGTADELLDDAPVDGTVTTVKKPVRFTFDGDTPPLQIVVSGRATPLDGTPSFPLRWTAHVEADAISGGASDFVAAASKVGKALSNDSTRASNPDPARELAMLVRRACGLLEALLACSQQSDNATTSPSASEAARKPKASKPRAGKREGKQTQTRRKAKKRANRSSPRG